MTQKHKLQGFTLIELMIVVAIIGILAAIAIPSYQQYTIDSANDACMIETKTYTHKVIIALSNQEAVPSPGLGACGPGSTDASASSMTLATLGNITGVPRSPGNQNTICSAGTDSSCSLSPL